MDSQFQYSDFFVLMEKLLWCSDLFYQIKKKLFFFEKFYFVFKICLLKNYNIR